MRLLSLDYHLGTKIKEFARKLLPSYEMGTIESISKDRTHPASENCHIGPPPSIIFCATLRRTQNHPRGSYIWVKLVCGSNAPVYFRIRHREPCENQLQRRKMLAKSGSGNNAQTAGNQEFWRNIQGRLRACYRLFLDRFCVPDGGI